MNCGNCGQEFIGERWQKVCKPCYAAAKNLEQSKTNGCHGNAREKSIVRQVLYKVAAELLEKGAPAAKVNEFVKELEVGFYK